MSDEPCTVCNDLGTYPVINRKGQTLYEIRCPECGGVGPEPVIASTPKPVGKGEAPWPVY